MNHIILSPHLDDAVFSIGGFLHQLRQSTSTIQVWTIFAGANPPQSQLTPIAHEIQTRWGYAEATIAKRIQEDQNALAVLGLAGTYFPFQDAIYRTDDNHQNVINGEPDFVKPFNPAIHQTIIHAVQTALTKRILAKSTPLTLYLPLAMGNHPDHKILRIAIENIRNAHSNASISLVYYADFPYTIRVNDNGASYAPPHTIRKFHPIAPQSRAHWVTAITRYISQFPDYWQSTQQLQDQLTILLQEGSLSLWHSSPSSP